MIQFTRASLVLLAGAFLCTAQAKDFDKESLALRTALHHDASLELPLERLVDLYRESGKLGELVDLYRAHVVQYPGDPGGRAVLVRLLAAAGDPDATAAARVAVEVFPENGLLWYLLADLLGSQRDPGAADALAKCSNPCGFSPKTRALVGQTLHFDIGRRACRARALHRRKNCGESRCGDAGRVGAPGARCRATRNRRSALIRFR